MSLEAPRISKLSDGPHTPPAKKPKLDSQDASRPLDTPPSAHTDISTSTSNVETGNLDPVAARNFIKAYFKRHGDMKTDSKFQLASKEYLEDNLATYFQHAENHGMLFQRALGSNVIDLDKDGKWLKYLLKLKETDFDAARKQLQPPPIPPLPPKDEAFLEDLMTGDDVKLSENLEHLNRPGITDKKERFRNRWARNLINRWLSLCETGNLKRKDYSEQYYVMRVDIHIRLQRAWK